MKFTMRLATLRLHFAVLLGLLLSTTIAFAAAPTDKPADDDLANPTKLKQFNAGWGPNFARLRKMLAPDKDYVTWMIEEPPAPMDLRSAEFFRRSIVGSGSSGDDISHMMIQWQCHMPDGKLVRGGAAQTGENDLQTASMIKGGWGQSAFFAVFDDGFLNTPQELNDVIDEAAEKKLPLAHLTFEVTREKCQNMLGFLNAYLKSPKKPYTKFGVDLRPLKFEGGGCGSFASAMLTHAGILSSVSQPLLWRELVGSTNVMGSGLQVPKHTTLRLPKNYLTDYSYIWMGSFQMEPWSLNNGPHLHMVDPELGIFAMREIGIQYAQAHHLPLTSLDATGFGLRTIQSAHWRNIATDSHGDGAYVETEYPIVEGLDWQGDLVAQAARAEYKALLRSGLHMRPVKIGTYTGFLIAK